MSRKRHNVDQEATDAAGFSDRGGPRRSCRSYITHTGKQFLFGPDKQTLKMRCHARDRFRCTECGKAGTLGELDMHHVLPLGKGGDDTLDNVTTLCKFGMCHKSKHRRPMWGPEKVIA